MNTYSKQDYEQVKEGQLIITTPELSVAPVVAFGLFCSLMMPLIFIIALGGI